MTITSDRSSDNLSDTWLPADLLAAAGHYRALVTERQGLTEEGARLARSIQAALLDPAGAAEPLGDLWDAQRRLADRRRALETALATAVAAVEEASRPAVADLQRRIDRAARDAATDRQARIAAVREAGEALIGALAALEAHAGEVAAALADLDARWQALAEATSPAPSPAGVTIPRVPELTLDDGERRDALGGTGPAAWFALLRVLTTQGPQAFLAAAAGQPPPRPSAAARVAELGEAIGAGYRTAPATELPSTRPTVQELLGERAAARLAEAQRPRLPAALERLRGRRGGNKKPRR